MELPVALLFDCVLRRGELLGLRYSDIDFDKKGGDDTIHMGGRPKEKSQYLRHVNRKFL